jgi:predicted secreted protein
MTDTNIGAGKIILALEGDVVDTFVDIGELYDPIPEIEVSRDGLDDTNTKSKWERTKAGMRKAAPVAFKIKTTAAGSDAILAAFNDGAEKRWKFTIPDDSTTKGEVEEIIFKAWVGSHKKMASLKDETFINFTANINEVED